jgi:hypothetical protein
MLYAAIDIHKRTFHAAVLDVESGETSDVGLVERREHELRRLEPPRDVEVARDEVLHATDRRTLTQGAPGKPVAHLRQLAGMGGLRPRTFWRAFRRACCAGSTTCPLRHMIVTRRRSR